MNKKKLEKVKQLHAAGLSYRQISKKLGISTGSISNVLNGKINLDYNRKDPSTWSQPEAAQKLAFSTASSEAKGMSMEKVIESVTVATDGKTFKLPLPLPLPVNSVIKATPGKPLSNREFTRMLNNMEKFNRQAGELEEAVKGAWDKLPPHIRSGEPVPVPVSSGVLVPERHGSGVKMIAIVGGLSALAIGGLWGYDKLQKKVGTETSLRLLQKLCQVASGITED